MNLGNLSDGVLIFGGLTLGLLFLIWVVYRIVTNHGHDWKKTVDRNSDAFIEHAKSMSKLGGSIESSYKQLSGSIKDLKEEIRSRK